MEQKEILGRVDAEIGHDLAKAIQLPALSRYSTRPRRDPQKEESITQFRVARVASGLFQKCKNASGDCDGDSVVVERV